MVVYPQNATGWSALYDAHIMQAAWDMYTAAWGGWFMLILFLVMQFMVYLKTRNFTLGLVLNIMFIAMFVVPRTMFGVYINSVQIGILILLALAQLTAILIEAFGK